MRKAARESSLSFEKQRVDRSAEAKSTLEKPAGFLAVKLKGERYPSGTLATTSTMRS
jgi:hypothetical protein